MSPPRSRGKTALTRTLLVLGAIGAALAIAEIGFRARDLAAFPHLRCYVDDPVLGVRLEPGRSERIQFGGAEVTTVRINADGLRGPALPAPSTDEILVVGDSQAFGLGVEEDQTFSAVLSAKLGRTVINAGVPTYGPLEYARMVEERLDARPAKTVIVLLAYQNDFFEAERPNVERHAVWDGWAVRKESAPDSVMNFPGRALLFRDSHLVYAWRRWLHGDASPSAPRVASGGTVRDFLPLVERVANAREEVQRERSELLTGVERANNRAQTRTTPDELVGLLQGGELSHDYVEKRALLRAGTAHPGDIIQEGLGEGETGLSLKATASVIAQGAKLRKELVERWWERNGDDVKRMRQSASELQLRLNALRVASNPITPSLQRIAERCKKAGAQLLVLGLPTDTMVDAAAFAKYGESAIDMSGVGTLTDDLRVASESVGATWMDLSPVLAPLRLRAFLPREFHLSVAGHAAVGEDLAQLSRRMALPRPSASPPLPGFSEVICEGCSADVDDGHDVDIDGRLYLPHVVPLGDVWEPAMAQTRFGALIELAPGEEVSVMDRTYRFRVTRSADGAYHLTPSKQDQYGYSEILAKTERCAPEAALLGKFTRGGGALDDVLVLGRGCADLIPEEERVVPGEGASYLPLNRIVAQVQACATGDASFAPACKPGEVRVGPAGLCRALCNDTTPCPNDFRCVAYRGAQVCAPLAIANPTCAALPSKRAPEQPTEVQEKR